MFAEPSEVRSTLSVLGFLVLVVSALSFCRLLQRLYERAWRLPSLGVRGTPAQLAWLGRGGRVPGGGRRAQHGRGPLARAARGAAVSLAFGVALWLWTPYLLLGRRVPRRRLRVTAVLTAVSLTAMSLASIVYMPHAIASSAGRFGAIGVAMAMVSWLIGVAFVIVGATVVAAVWGGRSAPAPAGRAEAAARTSR